MEHIISLGGGVQSTAMLLMACHDELTPKPMCAIFSDTGWERQQTYDTVKFLEAYAEGFGIPVYTVSNGNIREDTLNPNKRSPSMPFFINTEKGKKAMLRRQCTADYKIRPIRKKIRELLPNSSHKNPVQMWIGISLDEVQRMKPSDVKWLPNKYPLIEKRLRRNDCVKWMRDNGFQTPVKSSCIGCPFHDATEWRSLNSDELADAIEFDNKVREIGLTHPSKKKKFADNRVFLHRDCVPLSDLSFETNEDQQTLFGTEEDTCGSGCWL